MSPARPHAASTPALLSLAAAEAAAGSSDTSSLAPSTATDGKAPGATTSLDPEQQLLAWLSGAALQPGAGVLQSGGAAPSLAAIGLSGDGTQSADGASPSEPGASSNSSDANAALSTDPSQTLSPLLSAHPAPVHLGSTGHTGAAQQAAGALQSPLGTSAWVEELGAQLSWMAHRGIETASLHVSPAELGPIEVRIAVHGSDASVWFGAAQAATRTALEHALPQLRQLLASHGLALADAGVFREPPRGSAHQAPSRSLAPVAALRDEPSRAPELGAAARLGLLDLYA